ncbi:uncharacterized protein VICG_01047, partial [Vittaforma corneae ATCC 50505]
VRFVDDFLIATEAPENIKKFFEIADSLKDKGFIVNQSKIRSNIDLSLLNGNSFEQGIQASFVSDHIEWCGMKIYDQGVGVKSICRDPYFRYTVSVSISNRGKRIFDKIKRSLNIKLAKIYINKLNKKLGECIFDALFFCGRRLKIMMLRLDFVNTDFVERILDWCVNEVERVLKSRNIIFDREKIDRMSNIAYEKCGVRDVKGMPHQ